MGKLQALLRNKKAVLGLAAAGGLGLVVALKKKSAGSSSAGSDAASSAGTGSGGVATYDSTGSDVANQLGQFSNSINNSLSDFQTTLTNSLDALQNVPTGTSNSPGKTTKKTVTVTPPKKVTPPGKKPVVAKKPTAAPPRYIVKSGDNLSTIAKRNRLSLTALKRLNPGLFNTAHRNGNLIHPGEAVRLH